MAIVQDTEITEEEQGMDQPKLGGGESQELVQGVASGAGDQKSGPTTDQRGTTAGTRLRGLKKYVEAGRKSNMAQKIQGGMEDIRKGVETGIGQAQTGVQQAAEAEKSRLTKGEQLVQESQAGGGGLFEQGRSTAFTQDISPVSQIQQPETLGTGTDGIAPQTETQAAPDFSQFGQTAAERLGEFGRYKGGEREQFEIQDQQKLQQDISDLQKRAGLAQSEAGRYQLLRETFNRPGYTTGQQRLDQLILQAAPEQSQTLQEMSTGIADPVKQQFADLQAYLQTEQGSVDTQAQALAQNIGQQLYGESGQAVIDPATGQVTDVGGVLGEFRTGLEGRVGEAQTKAETQLAAITDMMERGYDIDPQLLTNIGVTDPEQQQQFMDYYQRGQGRTLGTAIEQGGADIDELRKVAEMTGTNYEDMKAMYTGQPMSKEEFAAKSGVSPTMRKDIWVETSSDSGYSDKITVPNPDYARIDADYQNYVGDVQAQSEQYRNQLNEYIGQNLGGLRVKGPKIDYSKYVRGLDEGAISAANVGTAEDYARQAALEQLANLQFGPLSQAQIGQAGTVGDVGYGRFGLGEAMGEARNLYETPTYSDFDRVSAPQLGPLMTMGQIAQREGEVGTQAVAEEATRALEPTGLGQIAESTVFDPAKAAVDQTLEGITQPMTDVELGAGRMMEGDVLGGSSQIMLAPSTSATQAVTAPAAGIESLVTGEDRASGLADDYTQALSSLSYGDFDASSQALGSTVQMPEQITRDAVAKVDKVFNQATSAVSNAYGAASKAVGTFWCTEMTNRGILSADELDKIHTVMYAAVPFKAKYLSWYIDNGESIIAKLVKIGYDWNEAKPYVNNMLELFSNGKIFESFEAYEELAQKLAELTNTEIPSGCSGFSLENLKYLPKVINFHIKRMVQNGRYNNRTSLGNC